MSEIILTLPENVMGRDFIVGDIHGSFDLLDAELAKAKFNPAHDRVISVGDLINRGPRSADVLDYLSKPWFHAVRGNHEELFIRMYESGDLRKSAQKSDENLKQYGWVLGVAQTKLDAIYAAFTALPVAMEIDMQNGTTVGIVHADVPCGMNWKAFRKKLLKGDEKTRKAAIFERERIEKKYKKGVSGIDRVIFGHTVIEKGFRRLGNCMYVDTGAYKSENKPKKFSLTLVNLQQEMGISRIQRSFLGRVFRKVSGYCREHGIFGRPQRRIKTPSLKR